ncbi:dynein assembly factor 4, axonemal-like, partial [Stegodyphus dumicola]|uniref:dynein assembly factor 4, axonemal-like n=1 Tax=Stegodyphus dumicola TaxID=202533 RepID=UPI0015A914B9
MPLIINSDDVKWHETKERISIVVPLFSRVDVKTSILTTSRYLKVSSPPSLWECFLAAAVDPATSIARIGHNNVSFDLRKQSPELWNDLTDKRADCEEYRRKERENAYEENQAELHQTAEMKSKKQNELHQASVRKQMHLEDQERRLIEKEKRMENERVTAAIEQMKKEQARVNRIIMEKKEAMQKLQNMPPPRKSAHITVSFTPRVFPTAARESMEAEENE